MPKILHVIPSISQTQGGPSVALPLMCRSILSSEYKVEVLTTDDDGLGKHSRQNTSAIEGFEGVPVHFFPKQCDFYKISLPLLRWLQTNISAYDLLHIHALFSFSSISAARIATRRGIPFILRPLGVLNKWGLEHRRPLLKQVSLRLLELPLLKAASRIHFTSKAELIESQEAGVEGNGIVIPLGIDLEDYAIPADPACFLQHFPDLCGKSIVLFLSRIDPKKGLDLLLPAFADATTAFPDAVLAIAGKADSSYSIFLKTQIELLGLTNRICFVGFLKGEMKRSAFQAASLFVLPSHSENFGIAAIEALAAGTPTLLTSGVAVSEGLEEAGAAVVVQPNSADLSAAIERLLRNPESGRTLGEKGRAYALEHFSMQAMGSRLCNLYNETLQKPTHS